MKRSHALAIFALSLFCIINVEAASARPEAAYAEYYTFDERPVDANNRFKVVNFQPLPVEFGPQHFVRSVKSAAISLLRWALRQEQRPQPEEAYIRKLHFGRWINDPNDNTCMNTRARVLVRDTETDPTFRPNKRNKECVVDTGRWTDPYNGQVYDQAKDIQVDHMVPLKSAYLAGAWAWDYKTRCLYANYMGFKAHLIPSSVRENTSKGDRGPEKYLPPDHNYRCQYVKDWLAIKLIWKLNMTTEEVIAIDELVHNYRCDLKDFNVSLDELKNQRQFIQDNIEFCMINKR